MTIYADSRAFSVFYATKQRSFKSFFKKILNFTGLIFCMTLIHDRSVNNWEH